MSRATSAMAWPGIVHLEALGQPVQNCRAETCLELFDSSHKRRRIDAERLCSLPQAAVFGDSGHKRNIVPTDVLEPWNPNVLHLSARLRCD